MEKAYRDNPDAPLFARLADLYLERGLVHKAVTLCEEGCDRFPEYATGFSILSKCYEAQDKLEDARTAMDKSLRLDPRNPLGFLRLSGIYEELGISTLALKSLQQAATLDPFNVALAEQLDEFEREVAADPGGSAAPAERSGPEEQPAATGQLAHESESTLQYPVLPAEEPETAVEPDLPSQETDIPGPEQTLSVEAMVVEPDALDAAAPLEQVVEELPPTDAAWEISLGDSASAELVDDSENAIEPDPSFAAEIPAAIPDSADTSANDMVDLGIALFGTDSPSGSDAGPDVEAAPADLLFLEQAETSPEEVVPEPPSDVNTADPARQDWAAEVADTERVTEFVAEDLVAQTDAVELIDFDDEDGWDEDADDPLFDFEMQDITAAAATAPQSSTNLKDLFNQIESHPDQAAPVLPPKAEDPNEGAIGTETLADIYASQGLLQRAIDTYRQLLDQQPDNEHLRGKIAAIEQRQMKENSNENG